MLDLAAQSLEWPASLGMLESLISIFSRAQSQTMTAAAKGRDAYERAHKPLVVVVVVVVVLLGWDLAVYANGIGRAVGLSTEIGQSRSLS